MRLSAFAAGLFLVAIIFATDNPSAQAQEAPKADLVKNVLSVEISGVRDPINKTVTAKAPEPPVPPKPKEHIVTNNETLSKIAEAHATTWQRLFAKNLNIENPDIITVGTVVIIPLPDEVLPERGLPAPPPPPPARTAVASSPKKVRAKTASAVQAPRGSASGNGYGYGYCTYYAKQRRPDLPNNLGNANTWTARAAAQGIPTGSAPRVGAIGQQGMHVVYVEAVNGDGTIRVSEMNYAGRSVTSSRTAAAGSFQYIY